MTRHSRPYITFRGRNLFHRRRPRRSRRSLRSISAAPGNGKSGLTADHGFTLLEVLIALVLFSLLLVMLYGALFSGARSVRAGDVQARENDDKRLALSFIRRVTGETVPMFQVDRQGTRVMFRGDNSSLQFISRLPAHYAGSGLYLLEFEAQDEELLLRHTPLDREKGMFEEDVFMDAEAISLLGDIEAIDLDYYGREAPGAEPAWHNAWDNNAQLPELVRFRFIAGEPGSWPPLVIAVRSRATQGQPALSLPLEEEYGEG